MKKILVTGIDGFTGRYVAEELSRRGYDVIGLVYANPIVGQVACDLTDKEAVKRCIDSVKPDALIHLAALSFVGHEDQKAFYDVNVFGSLNILEAIFELGLDVSKIILASSANIYGNPDVPKINEGQEASPVNHYAMSKLAMEHMVKLWFAKLPIIVTRPFNYTGIGQQDNFLIPKIVSHFCKHKPEIELGNIDVSRDFSDVRDIAKSYVDLLESDVKSEVFNLCSGNVHSLSTIIKKMEDIAGYSINVKINPDFVRANEIKILGGDNSKLFNMTGSKPSISIDQTLFDMFHAN
ncbi:GDP-mannose 4,6-dehydratase [Psychromonas aquimarina]|uniref:GDP-mannose 4,6-dehydratase n=1 Tax=Psychromonas aquimarina TaxID=444919 RepID=UPI0004236BA7|nr:GDP-mannose 4,6-dehydratase [Psychromonas aquimarina]